MTLEIFFNLKDSEKCLVYGGVFLYQKLFQEEFCIGEKQCQDVLLAQNPLAHFDHMYII